MSCPCIPMRSGAEWHDKKGPKVMLEPADKTSMIWFGSNHLSRNLSSYFAERLANSVSAASSLSALVACKTGSLSLQTQMFAHSTWTCLALLDNRLSILLLGNRGSTAKIRSSFPPRSTQHAGLPSGEGMSSAIGSYLLSR